MGDHTFIVSPAVAEKAVAYSAEGRVTVKSIDPDGSIFGQVCGSRRTPYSTYISGAETLQVRGSCTCPSTTTCCHILSLLLQATANERIAA